MKLRAITTFNLAILTLFLGKWLNQRIPLLRRYNIPEPVRSGLLVCGFFVDIAKRGDHQDIPRLLRLKPPPGSIEIDLSHVEA